MFAEERKRLIVDQVNTHVTITAAELCKKFQVSPATIRNDLRDLELEGLLKRTHGGAIRNSRANFEPNAYEKLVANVEQKRKIALEAIRYVREGDTIALDTGSTLFELAKAIVGIKHLTIVTHDLQIASFLEQESDAAVILIGGTLRKNFHCTVGAKTLSLLDELNVDKAFLGSNGLNIARGITTPNLEIAKVKEKLIQIADEVYLLADSSKIGRIAFARFAKAQDINVLVTDSDIPPDIGAHLRDAGVFVAVAGGQKQK